MLRISWVALALALVVAGGCGGSTESDSKTTGGSGGSKGGAGGTGAVSGGSGGAGNVSGGSGGAGNVSGGVGGTVAGGFGGTTGGVGGFGGATGGVGNVGGCDPSSCGPPGAPCCQPGTACGTASGGGPGFSCLCTSESTWDCEGGCGPLTACGDQCVDLKSDPNHCGSCTTLCPIGNVCSGGICGCECSAGMTVCGAPCACVDLAIDPANCGGCGIPCALPKHCANGSCS